MQPPHPCAEFTTVESRPGPDLVPGIGYPRPRFNFVPALNGLRGIAILLVLGNHIPLRQYQSLLPGGFDGVDIFFVLSGFLITTLLLQEFSTTGGISLRNFYIRRVLRLGPALVVMLIAICILGLASDRHRPAAGLGPYGTVLLRHGEAHLEIQNPFRRQN